MSKQVSIIIPVYNEEKIIEKNTKKLVNFMNKLGIPYEIIMCDNGSEDRTPILGKRLEKRFKNKVKFISIPEKRCVGSAFKEMVRKASSNNLISLDMDLSINYEYFIPKCVELLKNYSIVIGTKLTKQKRPFHRKVMSKTFIFLVKLLLGLRYSDYSIGAKGYRKNEIVRFLDFLDRKTFYVIQLVFFAKREGLRIAEVPVEVKDFRRSRFNIPYDALYRGINLLSFWLRERIIKSIPNKLKIFPKVSGKVSP